MIRDQVIEIEYPIVVRSGKKVKQSKKVVLLLWILTLKINRIIIFDDDISTTRITRTWKNKGEVKDQTQR